MNEWFADRSRPLTESRSTKYAQEFYYKVLFIMVFFLINRVPKGFKYWIKVSEVIFADEQPIGHRVIGIKIA